MKCKLELTQEQLLIINEGLMNLPFKDVAPLINEINRQIMEEAPANPLQSSNNPQKNKCAVS